MTKVDHIPTTKKRKKAVRSKIHGTADRPRLTVFRSNQHIYLQAVDDDKEVTVASASDAGKDYQGTKSEAAEKAAKDMAEKLKKAKVKKLVFDRGQYAYHGRVKTVAETLRKEGLDF